MVSSWLKWTSVLSIVLAGKIVCGSTDTATTKCPEPFVNIEQKCYWFYRETELVDYDTAASKCHAAGASLVQIFDRNSQTQLASWIMRQEDRMMSYWIGLSDKDQNGEFEWEDGDGSTYREWAPGQPGPGRYCVAMSHSHGLKWKTLDCSDRQLFICHKKMPSSVRALPNARDSLEGFCLQRGMGYYGHPNEQAKYILCFRGQTFSYSCPAGEVFNTSTTMCEMPPEETSPPYDYDCDYEYDCDYTSEYEGAYGYGEGEEGTEYAGVYEEVGEVQGEEDGQGVEEEEEEEGGQQEEEEEEIIEYPEYKCRGKGYRKLGKKCYKIFLNPIKWDSASQACANENARLVVIKQKAAQKFLVSKLRRISDVIYDFWIGLNDKETSETYVWSDGSVLGPRDYQNWSKKARKRLKEIKKCVEITMMSRGFWNDEVCQNENGYICEKDAVNRTKVTGQAKAEVRTFSAPLPELKPSNSFCGTNRPPGEPAAIIGGHEAKANEHQWQVSLRSWNSHRCGASLIDSCWVLTAAHCVDQRATGQSKLPNSVVIGDHDTSTVEGTEKSISISRIILHPEWRARPVPTNDIALVELAECVHDVNTICLPGFGYDEFDAGDRCKVTGWGTIDPNRIQYPAVLQEATVPILSQEICTDKYIIDGERVIQDTMFCAGYVEGGIDTCNGDSGGPLACKHPLGSRVIQWGVISWGFGCAQRDRPGVYTRVTSYMGWIRNNTRINF